MTTRASEPPRMEPEEPAERPRCGVSELAPADFIDPVIEAYKRDIDRTLLIKNLELTPAQRGEKLVDFMNFLAELRRTGNNRPH